MSALASWAVGHLIFPVWARRDHPRFGVYLKEFEGTQFLDRRALESLQFRRLKKLLTHAYRHCPFYRCRMNEVGLNPAHLTSVEELFRLPVLTKKDIQDCSVGMQAKDFPAAERVRNQTGGSTGSPLQFYVDRERFDSRMASSVRHDRWAGLVPGAWRAQLWGARLDEITHGGWWDWCRNNFLYRTVSLNTSSIQEEDWALFTGEVRRKRPRFLVGYAQSTVLFARFLRERGIKDLNFDSVITTAEVLLPGQRELLEETFHTRVFNRYGCREVSVIASECEYHEGMHVNAEALLLEIVQDASIPAPAGKIVVTDLLNYSMPLIRYEIGDVGRWSERSECSCGRGLPLLDDVQGRITDFLLLRDGRRVSGPALTLVVADMPDVRQIQFVQKSLQSIDLRVVPGRNYGPHTEQELRRRLNHYVKGLICLEIETVKGIASERSGKHRFVINEVEGVSLNPYAPQHEKEQASART